jgi:hypothetical protein
MNINFYYLNETGEKNHDLQIPIFKLSISQKEGEVALAKLLVPTAHAFRGFQRKACIVSIDGAHETILFIGQQISFPKQIQGNLSEIELSAAPNNAPEQLQALSEELKSRFPYNALFFDQNDPSASDVLEASPHLFFWDRATEKVGITNIFKGRQTLDFSDHLLESGFSMRLGDAPYSGVQVNVRAKWIQTLDGELDLFPFIERCFPKNKINTLTPHFMQHHWPKVGSNITRTYNQKRSGYQVVESCLKCIQPPYTGALNVYPTLTPEITPGKRLKRYWMDGKLVVSYHYRQKHQETASFLVPHHHQPLGGMKRIKTLNLTLQKIENPISSTFFETSMGQECIDFAKRMAETILANSARCLEIEGYVPLDKAVDISLDHNVFLSLDILPEKHVVGKVVAYKLIKTFDQELCWFRLLVSAGISDGQESVLEKIPTSAPFEKSLENYAPQDFIKSIDVQWNAEEQQAQIQRNTISAPQEAQEILSTRGTTITLKLADLRTQEVISKVVSLKACQPFQAPQQIKLGSSSCD